MVGIGKDPPVETTAAAPGYFLCRKNAVAFVYARKLLMPMTFARRNGFFRPDNTNQLVVEKMGEEDAGAVRVSVY